MNMPRFYDRSTRRHFLRGAGATGSLIALGNAIPGAAIPGALLQAAEESRRNDRILVVVEMAGGNDGLNTVIPYRDDAYRSARPQIGISASETLAIDSDFGLHPSLRGLADLLEQDRLAVVQGVGYPDPNRSHFESMDIWHTCRRKGASRKDGWLGRYLEASPGDSFEDPPALHLGAENQPLALMSRDVRVPSIESLKQFRLQGGDQANFAEAVRELANEQHAVQNEMLGFIQSTTANALATSQRMETIADSFKSTSSYPSSRLGKKLETVTKMVSAGLKTKVYYVRIDGFDTHANQPDAHGVLLREVSESISALMKDANAQGFGDRLLVMCFSEFGRRVAENASDGTDHGTAGPMLLVGNQVAPGLIGRHPSLHDLQDGDLKHHTDFRQIYAAVLENWFEVASQPILGERFDPVEILSS